MMSKPITLHPDGDNLTKPMSKAEKAAASIAESLMGMLDEKGVFEEQTEKNPLSGALEVERKDSKKIHLRKDKFQFHPAISTGAKGEKHLSYDVLVNDCFAGQLFHEPKWGQWYHLTAPQLNLDGSEEGDKVGESNEFEAAVKNLLKAKWPALYKDMTA